MRTRGAVYVNSCHDLIAHSLSSKLRPKRNESRIFTSMGIQLERGGKVLGVPAMALRDALRLVDRKSVNVAFFAERLGMSSERAEKLAQSLVKKGWITPDDHHAQLFVLTADGYAFSLARATKPIKRSKADALLAKMLAVCEHVNGDGSHPHFVEQLYVFGSYLSDKSEVGDLDVGYRLGQRRGPLTADQWGRWVMDYGYEHAAGGGVLNVMGCSELSILRALKQRSAFVSLHPVDDLDRIGAERRLVFESSIVASPVRGA